MQKLCERLSFANVISVVALFVALGGTGFAAYHLGKNAVGPKQLRKSAVTTAKVKNEAITAAKVKKGSLTGAQINALTLGTVPTAQTAQTANTVAASEPWHEVGAPGEPPFRNGWEKIGGTTPYQTVAFYKDHEEIVHLRGAAVGGSASIFNLPPGFRPARGKALAVSIRCDPCNEAVGPAAIFGSGFGPEVDGSVQGAGTTLNSLDGVTFRAES